MTDSTLTASDFTSGTWGRVVSLLETRLESSRIRLESMQSEESANEIRGRIAELRALLTLEADLYRTLDEAKLHDAPDYSPT